MMIYCRVLKLAFVRKSPPLVEADDAIISRNVDRTTTLLLCHAGSSLHNWPAFVITGSFLKATLPELLPVASMALTIFIESASATSPKTTCFPSSQPVTTVVMKNWDPLL